MDTKLINYALCIWVSHLSASAFGQEDTYVIESNIPYYNESVIKADQYIKERCVLA